jgi:diguanylate cyclase (GGDEF)-like protein
MAETASKYHIFIAHSAADKDIAEELYFSLNGAYNVFLDTISLKPGDRWDEEIAKAQRESLLTVVLISERTEASYYEREEIAIAINLSRQKKASHRVIPVYLSRNDLPGPVPYGLRLLQGIYIDEWADIGRVGKKLRKLLNELENQTMGNAGNPVLSSLNAFRFSRKTLLKGIKQRFHDAFRKLETPYLSDFFYSLANKNTEDEFMTTLEEIGRTHLEKRIELSMVYMDVDGFSQINKKYGRELGDEVIKIVNVLFEDTFREYYFTKWGKDEFISFLSGISEDSALELSEQLRYKIRSYSWSIMAPDLYVTGSFGVAQLKHDERTIEWIVRTIHGSISAKRFGGNKVESGPFILPPTISRSLRAYVS